MLDWVKMEINWVKTNQARQVRQAILLNYTHSNLSGVYCLTWIPWLVKYKRWKFKPFRRYKGKFSQKNFIKMSQKNRFPLEMEVEKMQKPNFPLEIEVTSISSGNKCSY